MDDHNHHGHNIAYSNTTTVRPLPASTTTGSQGTVLAAASHDHHQHHHIGSDEQLGDVSGQAQLHDHGDHQMKMWFHGGCTEVGT